MANVLIDDDSTEMSSVLSEYIKKEGYNVLVAADGGEALDIFSKNELDMVFLDVTMPVLNGYDVCREIRKTSNVPVIMVTSHGDDYEKIMGLGIGADDYIVKPCSPNEVVARMRALLRRIYFEHSEEGNKAHFRYENLEIDMDNFRVSIDDKQVPLTKKELEILWTLADNRDKVFTRENLLNSLWGYDYYGDCRTVDSHIKRLRAKLDEYPHDKWNIKTVWGMGYKFEVAENNEK